MVGLYWVSDVWTLTCVITPNKLSFLSRTAFVVGSS